MDFTHRAFWLQLFAWTLTGCMTLPTSAVPRATVLPLSSPSISSNTQVHPVAHEADSRSSFGLSGTGNSPLFLARPARNAWSSSPIGLSQNGDGSVSIRSDGRPVFLLRGLDPALVNPAVLPFLIPSCEAPLSR